MDKETNSNARIERFQTMYGALAQITVRAQLNPQEITANANSIGFCMQEVLNMVKEEQEKIQTEEQNKDASSKEV
jgi:hypothetical protein